MITRRTSLALIGGSMATLAAPTVLRAQAPRNLRVGHAFPESHPYHKGLSRFADETARLTGGAVTMTVYPSGQLGADIEMIEGMGLGTIDGAAITSGHLALTHGITRFNLLDMPFLFKDYDAIERFVAGPLGQKLTGMDPATGIRVCGVAGAGFHQILNGVRPINGPADLKGLKLRVWQSPSARLAFEIMGASPTPMDYSEVFTAVQQRVVDGMTNSLTTLFLTKMFEVAKFLSITNHQYPFLQFVLSENTFQSLDAKYRDAVLEAGAEGARFLRAIYPAQDAQFREQLAAAGCQINEADRDAFITHVSKEYGRFAALVKEPGANEMIEELVALSSGR